MGEGQCLLFSIKCRASQLGAFLPHQKAFGNIQRLFFFFFFGCPMAWDAPGIYGVETSNAAKRLAMHSTAPRNQEFSSANVNSNTQVEKSWHRAFLGTQSLSRVAQHRH